MTETRKVLAIKCEVYSRVCGYYMPVEVYNLGKQEEFKNRVSVALPDEDDYDDSTPQKS